MAEGAVDRDKRCGNDACIVYTHPLAFLCIVWSRDTHIQITIH
jgi:hypothetical protein